MKKLIILFIALIGIASCNGCKKDVASVESIINDDLKTMSSEHSEFVYYEGEILLNNFLDEECDGKFAEFVNVFQTVTVIDSVSSNSVVHKIQHFSDGTVARDSTNGFWVENYPIKMEDVKVSYDSAFNLMMAVNLPKPHSKHVTLRKPMGPLDCNVQWIFGNIQSQIWIDALTGEIKESNPAFPDEEE